MRRFTQLIYNLIDSSPCLEPASIAARVIHVQPGILKQKQLCRILELSGWKASKSKNDVDAFGGWGRKKSGIDGFRLAKSTGKPFFALEDGFIRSVGLGQHGEPPLSIIMDAHGIYYDASKPSDLELLVNDLSRARKIDTHRIHAAMDMLKANRISKYNQTAKNRGLGVKEEGYVLVIDQTKDDPSITYGLASSTTFADMLMAAKRENPDQKIVIKTHPGVIAGIAEGHYPLDLKCAEFLVDEVNPWIMLEGASKVYTVTSGMGMEALIAGKHVRCFGAPYYAGYGLTDDEIEISRRSKHVSLENLFSAAYLEYPTYYDPYQDKLTTFEQTIETLAFLRDENELNRTKTYCLGMSRWKQKSVSAFLRSTHQEPVFLQSPTKALAKAKSEDAKLVIWASKCSTSFERKCKHAGVPLLKMEDGFLRSKGLGSDLVPPLSLVLDRMGIYYDPTGPSDLENLIEGGNFPISTIEAAIEIQAEIVRNGLTKYNVGKKSNVENLPSSPDKKIILVPGQVGDDASIRRGTKNSKICTNLELLQATRFLNPDAFILYKPHPDVEAGNRFGSISPHKVLEFADYVATNLDTNYALEISDEVWTLTSLIGLEALIRKKKVVCFGLPFYAGWGLTEDKVACDRRSRRATLDDIFAAAYLMYSKYIFRGLDGYMRMPAKTAPTVLLNHTRNNKTKT